MTYTRAHIKIIGLVQGVFFRASAMRKARTLGITGWIRNLDDGSLEIIVEGELSIIDNFIAWCKFGPPNAKVERIHIQFESPKDEFNDFRIIQ